MLRVIKGALIVLAIVILTLLPPLIHFITGPLGPFIGGFVSGRQLHARVGEAFGIGLVVAGVVAAPAFLLALSVNQASSLLVLGIALYFGVFAALGAIVGGARTGRGSG